MAPSVLLLGASGFLGGTVLTDLEKGDYMITCVVRPEREACLSGRKTRVLLVSLEISYLKSSPKDSMDRKSQWASTTACPMIAVDTLEKSCAK